MSVPNHKIAISFGLEGSVSVFRTTEDILSYTIVNDMLSTADSFSFEMPLKRELWDLTQLDAPVQMYIDGTQVLAGFVDSRRVQGGATDAKISVSGRDRAGRLVDESAPFVKYGGIGIADFVKKIAGSLFKKVTLENASNRALITGRRGRGVSRSEPPVIAKRGVRKQTRPGESKSQVMDSILEQAELMAWSTADGESYVVGNPLQRQTPLWSWLYAEENSSRADKCNVLSASYSEDIGERYSEIRVVGTGSGDNVNFGSNVTRRFGVATSDFPFSVPKVLIIGDPDIDSSSEAKQRAELEMAEREASGKMLDITLPGHGQNGLIYAFDTVGSFEYEEIGLSDDFYITRVEFKGRRAEASTSLSLVPVGTDLRVNG